jgi:hypothetical protein
MAGLIVLHHQEFSSHLQTFQLHSQTFFCAMQYSSYCAKVTINFRFLKPSGQKKKGSHLAVLTVQFESVAVVFKEICKQTQQYLNLTLTRYYFA